MILQKLPLKRCVILNLDLSQIQADGRGDGQLNAYTRVMLNSLIADEVWERLRDEYVFRSQITTCAVVRHFVSLICRQSAKGAWKSPHVCSLEHTLTQKMIRLKHNIPPI